MWIGCYMRSLCAMSEEGDSYPYCKPFSILADICAKDMPKMNDCHVYTTLCLTPGSTVEQCRLNPPVQGLPTTSQAKKLVQNICQEMEMTGCVECTSDLRKCNGLKTYSNLCYQMPGMSQCGNHMIWHHYKI